MSPKSIGPFHPLALPNDNERAPYHPMSAGTQLPPAARLGGKDAVAVRPRMPLLRNRLATSRRFLSVRRNAVPVRRPIGWDSRRCRPATDAAFKKPSGYGSAISLDPCPRRAPR